MSTHLPRHPGMAERNRRVHRLLGGIALALAAATLPALTAAQSTPAPAAAPGAASMGERAASSAEARVEQAPTVRESQDTRTIDLRPELKPTPMVKMPLGRREAKPPADAKSRPATTPAIDDGVARCLARDTRSQRRDCLMLRPG